MGIFCSFELPEKDEDIVEKILPKHETLPTEIGIEIVSYLNDYDKGFSGVVIRGSLTCFIGLGHGYHVDALAEAAYYLSYEDKLKAYEHAQVEDMHYMRDFIIELLRPKELKMFLNRSLIQQEKHAILEVLPYFQTQEIDDWFVFCIKEGYLKSAIILAKAAWEYKCYDPKWHRYIHIKQKLSINAMVNGIITISKMRKMKHKKYFLRDLAETYTSQKKLRRLIRRLYYAEIDIKYAEPFLDWYCYEGVHEHNNKMYKKTFNIERLLWRAAKSYCYDISDREKPLQRKRKYRGNGRGLMYSKYDPILNHRVYSNKLLYGCF